MSSSSTSSVAPGQLHRDGWNRMRSLDLLVSAELDRSYMLVLFDDGTLQAGYSSINLLAVEIMHDG